MPSSACQTCARSEEHTSELQSHSHLVCRLLLEKTKHDRSGGLSPRAQQTAPPRQVALRAPRCVYISSRAHAPCQCAPRGPRLFFFFFNDTATPKISPLPLPDALPI